MGVSELECADTCKGWGDRGTEGWLPAGIVRNHVAQWEHVFIPLWSPYITHLGKWIGLTLHVTVFTLPSIHKWQRERKYSRDFIFWSGVWIVRGIWRMKLSLLASLFETLTDSLWCLSPFSLLKSAYLRDYIRFFACFCRLSI